MKQYNYLSTFPILSTPANRYHLDSGDLRSIPCIGAPVVIKPRFMVDAVRDQSPVRDQKIEFEFSYSMVTQ